MSAIKHEIARYMNGPARSDAVITSSFTFPPEFIGFQGHFPTGKVLPGACQIQCVLSTVEKTLLQPVALKEIVLAKFVGPVIPGDTLTCAIHGVVDTSIEFIVKAHLTKGAEKVSDLKLRVCVSGAI